MTLISPYSTEQLYNEWINGTPISEIVKKTGIKRKTWNKRFERYEKHKHMATFDNSLLIQENKSDANVDTKVNPLALLIALIIFGLIAFFTWL